MSGVVVGLPSGFLPSPEAAVSDGCVGSWIKVQPNNLSKIESATTTLSTSAGVLTPITFPSQQINFTIGGSRKGMWIDCKRSYISFRLKAEITTALGSASASTTTAYLQAGAMSWFNRQTTYNAEGSVLDDLTSADLAFHHDSLYTTTVSGRDSMALHMGFLSEPTGGAGFNYVQGHNIPVFTGSSTSVATGSNMFAYSVPLFNPVIGSLNRSGFFPLGHTPKLDLQFTTAAIAPITISASTALNAGAVKYTLDNFSINLWAIYLDGPSMNLLGSPREHYVKSKTYRVAVNQIPSGTSGQNSYLIGARGRSVRSIATRISDSVVSTAASASGQFDSKLPLAVSINYLLNGRDRVPPNPINLQTSPAECFLRGLYAQEEYDPETARSSVIPQAFCRYWATNSAPAAGTYDQNIITAASDSTVISLSSFSFNESLQKLSVSKIMDGVNLSQSASHFLEINIDKAPTNSQNLSFISCLDCIYTVDMETGLVSVLM
jgi:hypothetical protein